MNFPILIQATFGRRIINKILSVLFLTNEDWHKKLKKNVQLQFFLFGIIDESKFDQH